MVAETPHARDWLTFQASRGLALNTINAYGRNVERYLRFLVMSGQNVAAVTHAAVSAYVRDLLNTRCMGHEESSEYGFTNATVQQHLTTLRLFYDYLVEEDVCARNRFRRGYGLATRPLVQKQHKLPWIPSEEEWCTFLAAASREPIRNRVMLAMSYDAGLRREELCLLETRDIDPSRRTLRVRAETTKNRRERVLPYSVTTDSLFGRYLEARSVVSRQRGPLFLSESTRNRGAPISIWTWSKVVAGIARRAGLPGFTPHTLRHLCLTDLARADWDIHEIATFAGHRSVQTTMIYVHLSARDLARKLTAAMAQVHQQHLELIGKVLL